MLTPPNPANFSGVNAGTSVFTLNASGSHTKFVPQAGDIRGFFQPRVAGNFQVDLGMKLVGFDLAAFCIGLFQQSTGKYVYFGPSTDDGMRIMQYTTLENWNNDVFTSGDPIRWFSGAELSLRVTCVDGLISFYLGRDDEDFICIYSALLSTFWLTQIDSVGIIGYNGGSKAFDFAAIANWANVSI